MNFTVSKFASGRTWQWAPQLAGASAIHSAEVWGAEVSFCVVEKVLPVVTFVIVIFVYVHRWLAATPATRSAAVRLARDH